MLYTLNPLIPFAADRPLISTDEIESVLDGLELPVAKRIAEV